MIELLFKPNNVEREPWHMFFIGLLYSIVALALVSLVFANDTVLSEFGGILVVTFTVICAMPFMYHLIKLEEGKDIEITKSGKLLKEHSKALKAMMWLFMGLVIGFSLGYILVPSHVDVNFNAQIRVFCAINSQGGYDECVAQKGLSSITGNATKITYLLNIFANNVYVLMFTLLFSLAFGAGAIFILVWNASVIAVAIGVFTKGVLSQLPLALARYMIHGIPEIAAYFIAALAGGIVSVAVIRKDLQGQGRWKILEDALLLIIIAVIILLFSAIIEVYVSHALF